jgi:acetyl esterase/lipase
MSIWHYQPFKALYVLLAVIYELARFPIWVILYIPWFLRPNSKWSLDQAIRVRVVKLFLRHYSAVRVTPTLSLKPGAEGDRWAVVQPNGIYKGPTDDPQIKPGPVGVTWTPEALQRSQVSNGVEVVLHFHGGAYIMGDGRDQDAGFAAQTIHKYAKVTHVVTPQYRLACNDKGRFPAALQDAITVYTYLIEKLRVPAKNITISGDSAGGNLGLALLRYISEYGVNLGLPWPGAVWLWSPWTDVPQALNKENIATSEYYSTDYLNSAFGHWGAQTFSAHLNPYDPYMTCSGNAFLSKSPIWVQTGTGEVLYPGNLEIAHQFRKIGTVVEVEESEAAPHDIILVGNLVGFQKAARIAATKAGDFLRANRLEK